MIDFTGSSPRLLPPPALPKRRPPRPPCPDAGAAPQRPTRGGGSPSPSLGCLWGEARRALDRQANHKRRAWWSGDSLTIGAQDTDVWGSCPRILGELGRSDRAQLKTSSQDIHLCASVRARKTNGRRISVENTPEQTPQRCTPLRDGPPSHGSGPKFGPAGMARRHCSGYATSGPPRLRKYVISPNLHVGPNRHQIGRTHRKSAKLAPKLVLVNRAEIEQQLVEIGGKAKASILDQKARAWTLGTKIFA